MMRHIPYILALIYLLSGTAHAAFTGHGSGTGTYTPLTQTVDVDNMTATASTTGIDDRALLLDNDGTNNKWTLTYTWLWIKNKADSYYADAITDPGADTVRVWDDTDGAEAFATFGTGLSYDHATKTISAPGTLGSTDIDTSAEISTIVTNETGSGALVFATSPTLVTPILGTPTSGTLTNCTFPTLNQNTTGSAGSLLSTGSTGKMTVIGPGTGTTRSKTVRDANDTILELGGSYTPTGTWDWSSATLTFGTLAPTALNLKSSNADPGATAGQIKHDSTVAGLTTGSLVWYDGDEFRYPVDLDTLGTESEDGYFVKYDYSNGKYVLDEATAVNALDDLTDVVITSAQRGDILYRGASGWVNLHNDIAGEFLRTNGDGADPSWETPAGGGDMSAASYPHTVAFEALAVTDGNIAVGNGSTWVAESGATARTSLGAAASGANSDITSLLALTTALASTMGGMGVKNDAASTVTISGAYPLTVTLSDTTGVTFPTSGTLATTAQIPTASSLHLDDLLTAVGLASEATTLGTFTGSTIDDGSTVTEALQALETAAESASTPSLDIVGDMAADGSIGMTGYKLTLTSTLNAAGANITMTNTTADLTSDVSFFDLKYTDNGDANGFYLRGYDNESDLQWSIGQNGNISTVGTITSTATDSYLLLNNNSGGRAPTAASYESYVDAAIWKTNQNGTEYCNVLSPTAGQVTFTGPTAARAYALPDEAGTIATLASTQSFTNKTLDANATGNVLKGYGYITFTKVHNRGSAAGAMTTTETSDMYGVPYFAHDAETNNYVDYIGEVPRDWDTSVDPVAYFKFRLGGADTADHDYIVSMIDTADSGAVAGTPGDAINLAYTADAAGAEGDIETATATLTGWGAAATAGSYWLIRVTRDGDDGTNDASTVNSNPMTLTIRYGFTQ